jgi:parallel beta-helix repeat protein
MVGLVGGAAALGCFGAYAPAAAADTAVTCGATISAPGNYFLAANCSGPGITINASDVNLTLANHTMTGTGSGAGVLVDDSAGAIARVTITGRGTITNYDSGVQLGNGGGGVSASRVSQLTAKNSNRAIHLFGASGNTIAGNTTNFNTAGIDLFQASGNTIAANTANNNSNRGISLFEASGNTIAANTANNNLDVGIRLFLGATGNTIQDNTTNRNDAYGIRLDSTAATNTINHNTALNNTTDDLFDGNTGCDSNTWTANTFHTASPTSCIH